MKAKIFINYRKDDSPWNSLALYQELSKHFGKENIFKDFNTILPGTDFVESIKEALESCDVLLVLISEHWLELKDKKGNIRINNPDDFVRIEIATALERNIKVIPVLFDNAVLPQATELPDDLKKLSRRQFLEIDKTRFDTDTAKLVEAIKNILADQVVKPIPPIITVPDDHTSANVERHKAGTKKWLIIIFASLILLIFISIFIKQYYKSNRGDSTSKDSPVRVNDTDIDKEKQKATQWQNDIRSGNVDDLMSNSSLPFMFDQSLVTSLSDLKEKYISTTTYLKNSPRPELLLTIYKLSELQNAGNGLSDRYGRAQRYRDNLNLENDPDLGVFAFSKGNKYKYSIFFFRKIGDAIKIAGFADE